MKPLNLEFEAFLSYKDKTTIDFTRFDNSLFLIDGITGAGKTTIFDAICFALYGNLSDEGRDDDLKSDFADDKTECYVKLTFLQGGGKYTIRRKPKQERASKKKNAIALISDKEEIEFITPNKTYTKVKEANQKIKEIVKFDINQFRQTMMIAQGKFSDLVRADTEKRRVLFREILITQKFDEFKTKVKEKLDEAKDKSKTSNDLMNNHLHSFASEDEKTKELLSMENPANNDFDMLSNLLKYEINEEHKEYEKISNDLEIKRKDEVNLNTEINKIDQNNANLNIYNNQKNKYEDLKAEENKYKSLNYIIKEYEDSKKVKDLYSKYEEKENDLKEKDKDLKENNIAKDELEKEIIPAKIDYDKIPCLQEEFNSNKNKITNLNETKKLFKDKIKEENNLKVQNKKRDEKIDCLKKNENNTKKLNEEIKNLNEEIDKNKNIDVTINNIDNEITNINNEIQKQKDIKKKYSEFLNHNEKYKDDSNKAKKSYDEWQKKNEELTEAETAYKLNIAGILAEKLKKDTPCPVCGSKEHPHCATKSSSIITDETLELLRNEEKNLNQICNDNLRKCDSLKASNEIELKNILESLNLNRDDEIENTITKSEKDLSNKIIDAKKRKDEAAKIKQQYSDDILLLENKNKEIEKLQEEKNNINTNIQNIDIEIAKIKTVLSQLITSINNVEESKIDDEIKELEEKNIEIQNNIKNYNNTYNYLEKKITSHSSLISKISQEIDDISAKKEQAYKEYKDSLDNSILKDLDKINDCLNSYSQRFIDDSKNELDEFNSNLKASKTILENYLKQGFDKLTLQDKTLLESKLSVLENEIQQFQILQTDIKSKYDINKKAYDNYVKEYEANKELNVKTGLLDSLYKVTSGNVPGKPRIDFETYYQSQIFSQILDIASRKLDIMTSGRYQMQRHIDNSEASKNALDIDIFDTMTGKLRASNSLSGGETFMAALSLALGFSEFSRTKVGARELDCMFIDEGFGSLDKDSLNEVIRVLKDLSNRNNRMIGIISHVESIEDLITKKINVTKTSSGSKLTITD